MTGIIASGIKWTAEKLSSLLTSAAYAADETYETQNASVLEDLRKLERTMRRIQSILMDAGERDVEEHAKKLRLKELKEVAYDAEDVVGDYEYDVLHAKIQVRNRMLLGIDGSSGQKRKRQGEYSSTCKDTEKLHGPRGYWCSKYLRKTQNAEMNPAEKLQCQRRLACTGKCFVYCAIEDNVVPTSQGCHPVAVEQSRQVKVKSAYTAIKDRQNINIYRQQNMGLMVLEVTGYERWTKY